MSWRDRAQKDAPGSDWKSRAEPDNAELRAKEKTLEVIGKAIGEAERIDRDIESRGLEPHIRAMATLADPKGTWSDIKQGNVKNLLGRADLMAKMGMHAVTGDPTRGARAGAAQGLSLGFSDELEGGLNAVLAGGGLKINDRNDLTKGLSLQKPAMTWDQLKDAYVKARDARRTEIRDASEQQPYQYHGAEFVGGMAVPGGTAMKAKTAWQAAKAGAAVGAPTALVAAIGHDEDKPGEFSMPSPTQATMALGGGGLFGGLGGAAGHKVSGFLARRAEDAAVKAAGARGGIDNQLRKMGMTGENVAPAGEAIQSDIQKMGRDFLDEGLIPWGGSKQRVLDRAQSLQEKTGETIGQALENADEAGMRLDYEQMASAAEKALEEANAVERLAGGKTKALIDAFREQGNLTPGSFRGAHSAKSSAWQSANFKDDAPMAQQLYRQATGKARDNISEQLRDQISKNVDLPDGQMSFDDLAKIADAKRNAERIGKTFDDANKRYGTASKAQQLAEEGVTRDAANAGLGLTEALFGSSALGGGIASGNTLEALLLAMIASGATKAVKRRGWGPVSRSADAMSQAAKYLDQPVGQSWRQFIAEDDEQ